jgi:peptide/nickel transport system substrate-binding protein
LKRKNMRKVVIVILLAVFILSACVAVVDDPPTEQPIPTETSSVLPSPTPTEHPPVVLTVCTTGLPETLFPYTGGTSPAKARILSLLYPQPVDPDDALFTSQILDKLPSQSDGDLRLEPVPIRRGQTVINARGELVSAIEGVWVRPSGCRDANCAITWNGVDPLEMDQMVIDFKLRDDLTWSDGTPVSAGDSVFSFRLASAPDSPANGWAEAHTAGYSALDDRTVTWVGFPGFASPDLGRFFWSPLPMHAFDTSADFGQVADDALWTTSPPSYGPFFLVEWGSEALGLARNPAYFQVGDGLANQGLPDVDLIIFQRVAGGARAGWDAYQAGACDVLDASFRLASEPGLLAEIDGQAGVDLRVRSGEAWTQLVFGVSTAEYDTLNNPIFAQRRDYFADVRTRQGIAACLDRQGMAAATTGGWGSPWPSFVSPAGSNLEQGIVYNPEASAALLDSAGWIDYDGDPSTPRLSWNVLNVFNGTPFSVELLVGPSPFHQDLAVMIQEALTACGLGVTVGTLPTEEMFAPGPGGPLFGRDFDLALIAWQPLPGPDCGLYTSWAVPNVGNGWIGTNIAGFEDERYDRACTASTLALPGEEPMLLARAEAVFVELLPAVPLFAPPVVEVWGIGGSE